MKLAKQHGMYIGMLLSLPYHAAASIFVCSDIIITRWLWFKNKPTCDGWHAALMLPKNTEKFNCQLRRTLRTLLVIFTITHWWRKKKRIKQTDQILDLACVW